MFERRSNKTVVTTEPKAALPQEDPALRDERDPDPLIEEMVQRLREGLTSLNAYDEWGRPLAWRNVVRLAVGPLSGRLRDAETAAALAEAISPQEQPALVEAAHALPVHVPLEEGHGFGAHEVEELTLPAAPEGSLEPSGSEVLDVTERVEEEPEPLVPLADLLGGPVYDEPAPVAEPVAAEPFVAEPVAAEPVAAEPVAVQPVAVEPVTVEPVAAEPSQPSFPPAVDLTPHEAPEVTGHVQQPTLHVTSHQPFGGASAFDPSIFGKRV